MVVSRSRGECNKLRNYVVKESSCPLRDGKRSSSKEFLKQAIGITTAQLIRPWCSCDFDPRTDHQIEGFQHLSFEFS